MFRKKYLYFILLLLLLTALTACGGNEEKAEEQQVEESERTPVNNNQQAPEENIEVAKDAISVEDLAGNVVEFTEVPKRIIPFNAGDVEIVYSLGGNLVGRPTVRGEVPAYLQDIPEIGTTNSVNMETITSLEPDLVIAHPQLNAKDLPVLEELGIEVLLTGASSIDDIKASIEMVGKTLQKEIEATALNKDIDEKISDLKQAGASELRALTVFGVPGNWMVALPTSLSGSMLEAIGVYNVAKDYPKLDRFPQYAQMNIERIIEANPDVIFLISPGSSEKAKESFTKEMDKNPTWKSINAVKNGNYINLPNDLFGASPGSKIIESLIYLKAEIDELEKK